MPMLLSPAGDHSSLAIPQVSAPSSVYSSDDLSTLAVWFTVVKIMFVQGALTLLPQLCNILGDNIIVNLWYIMNILSAL